MEQRKEIVRQYVSRGLSVSKAVLISGISKSTYYHRPSGQPKGKRPSNVTLLGEQVVSNDYVVARINEILGQEFIDYGYQNVHQALRKQGFKINHKKVYRIMRDHNLLHPKRKDASIRKRIFVKFTSPRLTHPFAVIEIDIKFIYLQGVRRHAYLATAFDTFTRMAIDWELGFQMTNRSIGQLIVRSLENDLVKPHLAQAKVIIRTDNGPQFIASNLASLLHKLPIKHEFIRPGTPEQNGHIESFHATIKKLVTDRFEFADIDDARRVLFDFYKTYNHVRIMKSIMHCSPVEFLKNWERGNVAVGERNHKQFFFRERQSPS